MDMAMLTLYRIGMQIGDHIRMDCHFGTTQTSWLELIALEDMKRGWGRRYPYILEDAGRGIIADLPCDELKLLMEQIDKNGKTDEPIYYRDRIMLWDYRWFDLDGMNGLLKGEIELIGESYAPFWS